MMDTVITGGLAGATGMAALANSLTPAQLETFLPGTMGGEMNLAMGVVNGLPDDTTAEALIPARAAFLRKYDIHFTQYLPGEKVIVAAKSAPRFTTALLDATKAAREAKPAEAISSYLDAKYDTVPFDALTAAGLVTHEVVSDYLKTVQHCVLSALTTDEVKDSLRRIKQGNLFGNISLVGLVIGLVATITGLLTAKPYEPDTASVFLAYSGFVSLLAFGVSMVKFYGRETDSKASLHKASTALVALERQMGQIKEKE